MKKSNSNRWLICFIFFVLCAEILAKKKKVKTFESKRRRPKIKVIAEFKEAAKICQKKKLETRIKDGRHPAKNTFPWMAAIYYMTGLAGEAINVNLTGAGSIISKNYIVTSAHTTYNNTAKNFFVRLGDFNLMSPDDDTERGVLTLDVKKLLHHQNFNPDTFENDIALMRVNVSIKFGKFISPICVSGFNVPAWKLQRNDDVGVAGWGQTTNTLISPVLRYTKFLVWDIAVCEYAYNQYAMNDSTTICCRTWGPDSNPSPCLADDGGPLMPFVKNSEKPRPYLVGIISKTGENCTIPYMFTNVSSYGQWISKKAK